MKKLYALLVGINDYEDPKRQLTGCIKDVNSVNDYLEAAFPDPSTRQIKLLQDAGKEEVVHHLQHHFAGATKEDTVLFYFSGHGCQEAAPGTLQRFSGPLMEALVCRDSITTERPLADVEIRFLLHEIYQQSGGARIIIITDSCNSGGVSRDISKAVPRLGPFFQEPRNWDQFIFGRPGRQGVRFIPENDLKLAADLDSLLPQAAHIHLAACESTESAFELTGYQGIYTANLVRLLSRTKGQITFGELHNRLRYLVRSRFAQSPQIYAYHPGKVLKGAAIDQDLMNAEFLPGTGTPSRISADVHFVSPSWYFDRGEIHGMPPTEEALDLVKEGKLGVEIYDRSKSKIVTTADIREVRPGDTKFQPRSFMALTSGTAENYRALISGLYQDPLDVFLSGDEAGVRSFRDFAAEETNAAKLLAHNIRLAEQRIDADYQVSARKKEVSPGRFTEVYEITSPRDPEDGSWSRPLCKEVTGWNESGCDQLVEYLGKMAHWQFVRQIHNKRRQTESEQALHRDAIQWEFRYQAGWGSKNRQGGFSMQRPSELKEEIINPDETPDGTPIKEQLAFRTVDISFPRQESQDNLVPGVRLRVRLYNRSDRPLYVAMLYLGQLFDISSDYLADGQQVVPMQPETGGKPGTFTEVWGLGNAQHPISFLMEPFIEKYNWEEETFFLKLIISTVPFELGNTLDQDGLPAPDSSTAKDISTRSIQTGVKDLVDWATKICEVRVKNPHFMQHA